jgi:adenine phosphoribosyltransferase
MEQLLTPAQKITLLQLKESIRNVPNFPKTGIQFKDITTALMQPELLAFIVDTIAEKYRSAGITKVVCIESRGFILGGAVAIRLGAGFVPIRKPGKLPAATFVKKYALEYGTDSIEIHRDALTDKDVILIHDDLLATGGTAMAAIELVNNFSPKKVFLSFLCELDFLNGKELLKNYEISSLVHF